MPKKRTYAAPKTEFILAHPNLSGAEIVEKAKARGLEISRNLVYVIRSRRSKAPTVNRGRRPVNAPAFGLTAAEKRLAEHVMTIGLDGVERVLARVRKAFG